MESRNTEWEEDGRFLQSGATVVCVGGIVGDTIGGAVPKGSYVLENCRNTGDIVFDLGNAELPEEKLLPSHADGIIAGYYEGLEIKNCVSTGEIRLENGEDVWVRQGSWQKADSENK